MKKLTKLQKLMLSFAQRNSGWQSTAHKTIRTARSLAEIGLIELVEYKQVGRYKPTAQFKLK